MIDEDIKPYLCGPINGCADEEANNWRDQLINIFPHSINPMKRDYRGRENENVNEIVELDKRDVRSSSVVIVNYVKPSVGTSMEVFYAWSLGIPVIVWAPKDVVISPWLRYHSTTIVHTLNDVICKVIQYHD